MIKIVLIENNIKYDMCYLTKVSAVFVLMLLSSTRVALVVVEIFTRYTCILYCIASIIVFILKKIKSY